MQNTQSFIPQNISPTKIQEDISKNETIQENEVVENISGHEIKSPMVGTL